MGRVLIIDGQVFQTPAWHRGMGKYSLELIAALEKNNHNTWDDIHLILSANLKSEPQMLKILKDKAPSIVVDQVDLKPNKINNLAQTHYNRRAIDAYLSRLKYRGNDTDYLILSLLQSEIAPSYPSDLLVHKMLLFYDIIPFMFHNIYLPDAINKRRYLSKYAEFLNADTYLTISKTVANDLSMHLGVDINRIHNIDGGAVQHAEKMEPYPIQGPFILMPTGNDMRKNNKRAIIGFEQFRSKTNSDLSLVVTSSFQPYEVDELSKNSKKVVFTGNISGEKLSYLYQKASALLFPSEYEGLGMPIIEALEHGKPIVCSDIPVFREISNKGFHLFDPFSSDSIAEAIEKGLRDDSGRPSKRLVEDVLSKYTWDNSANKIIDLIKNRTKLSSQLSMSTSQKLVVFCSDPRNTISGKLAQLMNCELSRLADVEYVVQSDFTENLPSSRPNYLKYIQKTIDIQGVTQRYLRQKSSIHLISNDSSPVALLAALAIPGTLVLLDVNLQKLWRRALRVRLISNSRFDEEERIDNSVNAGGRFITTLLANHDRVIVHSQVSKSILDEIKSRAGLNFELLSHAFPSSDLAYDDILPSVKEKVAVLSEDAYGIIKPNKKNAEKDQLYIINPSIPLSSNQSVLQSQQAITDYERLSGIEKCKLLLLNAQTNDEAMIHTKILDAKKLRAKPVGIINTDDVSADVFKQHQVDLIRLKDTTAALDKLVKVLPAPDVEKNSISAYAQRLVQITSRDIKKKAI